MTLFDVIVLIIVGVSLLYSMVKGMVREIFSLIALTAGYLMALNFSEDLAEGMSGVIASPQVGNIIGFFLLFILTLLAVTLLGKFVRKVLHTNNAISGWDRLLGALFGVAKGLLVVVVLMFPLQLFEALYDRFTEDSRLAPYLERMVITLRDRVGSDEDIIRDIPHKFRGVKEKIEDFDGLGEVKDRVRDRAESFQEHKRKLSRLKDIPQDSYTKEDREQLDQLLNELNKE